MSWLTEDSGQCVKNKKGRHEAVYEVQVARALCRFASIWYHSERTEISILLQGNQHHEKEEWKTRGLIPQKVDTGQ